MSINRETPAFLFYKTYIFSNRHQNIILLYSEGIREHPSHGLFGGIEVVEGGEGGAVEDVVGDLHAHGREVPHAEQAGTVEGLQSQSGGSDHDESFAAGEHNSLFEDLLVESMRIVETHAKGAIGEEMEAADAELAVLVVIEAEGEAAQS